MAKKNKTDEIIARLEEKEKEASIIYADEETEQVVIFNLGQHLFAFGGGSITEILAFDSVTELPGLPTYFVGLITIRGNVESVINLKKVLSLPSDDNHHGNRILIAQGDDLILGVLVDNVMDVIEVPKSMMQPPLTTFDTIKSDYIKSEFEYRDQQVVYLSVSKVFNRIREMASHS